jgi:hypothetical protein
MFFSLNNILNQIILYLKCLGRRSLNINYNIMVVEVIVDFLDVFKSILKIILIKDAKVSSICK